MDRLNSFLKKGNYIISFFLLFVFFFVLMVHLSAEVRDLDLGLHLKSGEQIVLNKSFIFQDKFSFTKEGAPWVNHEWLFQVIAYSIYNCFGFDGLIVSQSIIFLILFLIIFKIGFRRNNFLSITTILFLLLLNSSYRFTIRPDMFSVLFLVLFIYILQERNKYLFLLIPLEILWVNLHGFFLLGPIVIFIYVLTPVLSDFVSLRAKRSNLIVEGLLRHSVPRNDTKIMMMFFFLCLGCTILNPCLVKGILYPFITVKDIFKDRVVFSIVQELKPVLSINSLFDPREWLFYKTWILVSAFSFRINQKRISPVLVVLWLGFLVFSLISIRNIVYFAFIGALVILYNLKENIDTDEEFSNNKLSKNKYYFLGRYGLILIFSFCMLRNAGINIEQYYYDFSNYRFKSNLWGISSKAFPEKAVDFILKENLPKRIFNDFNSGSYLIGRAYPQRQVFIDGRTEFYGNQFLEGYRQIADGNSEAIKRVVEKYQLEGFLLTFSMSNFDEKLAKYLWESKEWKLIYFDHTALIFLKDSIENKQLIDKFNIDLDLWQAKPANLSRIGPKIVYPYPYLRKARVLREISCFKGAISEAKEALKIMPDVQEAFEILGISYLELKKYKLSAENFRLAVAYSPDDLFLRESYAKALFYSGYYQASESQLRILLQKAPEEAGFYYGLALVKKKEGQLKEAKEVILKALKCNKDKENKEKYSNLYKELETTILKSNKILQ